jgi:hypothetical protein
MAAIELAEPVEASEPAEPEDFLAGPALERVGQLSLLAGEDWVNHYVLLRDTMLLFYDSMEAGAEPVAGLRLPGCTIRPIPDSMYGRKCSFEIVQDVRGFFYNKFLFYFLGIRLFFAHLHFSTLLAFRISM